MFPVIFYLNLSGVQFRVSSVYFTATLRFVDWRCKMKVKNIRILCPVLDVVDTAALQLKEQIARW